MGYREGQAEELGGRKGWNPFQLLTPAVNRLVTNIRRPHGYGTEKEEFAGGGGLLAALGAFVKDEPTYDEDENWTNRWGKDLYEMSFGGKMGEDSGWMKDKSGNITINPEAKGARTMQAHLNDAFLRASTEGQTGWSKKPEDYVGGKKYSHPDFPDAGENFYKGKVDVLGDVYFDEEGNYVDYYNYDLDKGEKLKGKANWMRKLISPFSTPPTVTGKAEKIPFSTKEGEEDVGWGDVGTYSPSENIQQVERPAELSVKQTVARDVPEDPIVAQDEKQNLFQRLFSKKEGSGGFQGEGGGTGVKTAPRTVGDYASAAKGPFPGRSAPIQRKEPIDRVPPEEGGGPGFFSGVGDNLGKLFGAAKGAFNLKGDEGGEGAPIESSRSSFPLLGEGGRRGEAPEGRGGINRASILKALGLGGGEEGGEDYRATMADKIRGLFGDDEEEEDSDYLGTAQQNVEMLRRMGGKGPSIVDFLKSQGKGSSFETRRKMWDQFG